MENKKLSQEELDTIKNLQERTSAIINELGNIELGMINLQERKTEAMTFLNQLKEDEQKFGKELNEKYGDGTVDLSTGEFVPAPAQA